MMLFSVAYSQDGRVLILQKNECPCCPFSVTDWETKKKLCSYKFVALYSAIYDPLRHRVLLNGDNQFYGRSLKTSCYQQTPAQRTSRVAYDPYSRYFVAGGQRAIIGIWNDDAFEDITPLQGHKHNSYLFDVALDGKRGIAITAGGDGDIRLWSLKDKTCLKVLVVCHKGAFYGVRCIAYDPITGTIISYSGYSRLRWWSVDTGECIGVVEMQYRSICELQCDSRSQLVFVASPLYHYVPSGITRRIIKGCTVGVWDLKTKKKIQEKEFISDKERIIHFSFRYVEVFVEPKLGRLRVLSRYSFKFLSDAFERSGMANARLYDKNFLKIVQKYLL